MMSNSPILEEKHPEPEQGKFVYLPNPAKINVNQIVRDRDRAKIIAEISDNNSSFKPPVANSSLNKDILSANNSMSDPTTNPAQIYVQQAQAYWQEQKWQQTIEACQKALAIEPKLVEAHKLIGNALQKTGKITEAMGYYAQAIEIKPDFAEVYANLGTIYAQQQKCDKAIAYYQKTLSIDPKLSGVYRNLARIWEQKQEPAKAQSCLEKSRQLESQQHSAPSLQQYLARAQQLQQQGNLEAAKQQYLNIIKLDSKNLEAYEQLLNICEKLEQWQQATQYCKIIVKINRSQIKSPSPQLPKALPSKSSTQLTVHPASKSREKAKNLALIQIYRKKAQDNPESLEIQSNLGILYAKEQQWQQAVAHLQKAISINPKLPAAYRNLARALAKSGKPEAAKKYWSQAIVLKGSKAKAEEHLQLGKNLVSWGKHQSALTCYRRAIQLKPNLVEAYLCLGELLAQTNQKQQTILCYQQGIKYNPKNAELYYRLGLAHSEQHQWLDATDCYQKVTQLQPQNAQAYHLLAEALTRQEKWEEASLAYQKAIALEP